jgi:hypothetical protein
MSIQTIGQAVSAQTQEQPKVDPAVENARAPEANPPKDERTESLLRKEKQIRKMQQQLAQERQAWEAKQNQYVTDYVPKSRLMDDPLAVLQEAGIDQAKLTEMMMSTTRDDPTIRALKAELRALKDSQIAAQKAAEEQSSQQYQQAIKQIGSEVKMLVDHDETFEMIKNSESYDAVVELIEQTFNKDGYLMDVKEAAQQVETYLLDEAYKVAQFKKVQARLAPKPAEENAEPGKPNPGAPSGMKTITHQSTQSPASPKKLTEKERIERAKAAFFGKLNQ